MTVLNFKDIIDLPKWRTLAPTPVLSTSFSNSSFICDFRNNMDTHPLLYLTNASTLFLSYNTRNDGWTKLGSPGLCNANYAGGVMMPSQGPRGTIAAGATTTSIPLSTVLPAVVGVNSLANRGDGRGFKVRIIGNAAGSSGLTEERIVIANTGDTTTPTIDLDSPLSFVPILGDTYEFLSGKVYLLGGTNGAGCWKFYDILTNSFSGNLATAGLPATTSDPTFIGLDELYVPYDRNPGEGFLNILTATASAAATITGQAVGGDAAVLINEYRNFQIRIVQDIATPTAVGQRRRITSHTAGPSPVYTVPAWAVQPSANATFVIENDSDKIIVWQTTSTSTFTYNITANAWDIVTFAVRPVAAAQGPFSVLSFGIRPDANKNSRHSFIYAFRGGTSTTLDLFDIAGAATGLWTANIAFTGGVTFSGILSGSAHTYDPATNQGRYLYFNPMPPTISGGSPGQEFFRFDIKNRYFEHYTFRRFPQLQTSAGGNRIAYTVFIDGDTKMSFLVQYIVGLSGGTFGGVLPTFGLPIIR